MLQKNKKQDSYRGCGDDVPVEFVFENIIDQTPPSDEYQDKMCDKEGDNGSCHRSQAREYQDESKKS